MDSPVLTPYRSFINIDRKAATPVYLQLAYQLIEAIQRGYLMDGHRLPGTRQMASILGLHRNTVVAGYAELEAQGWIIVQTARGTFIRAGHGVGTVSHGGRASRLKARDSRDVSISRQPGFSFKKWQVLDDPFDHKPAQFTLDDGLPDPRLSHVDYLSRLFHTVMKRRGNQSKLAYHNRRALEYYKENLANFLNLTRGLHVSGEEILVTRSLELSIYLVAETLLSPGDHVVVGELSYFAVNMILQKAGAKLVPVPVDGEGLNVTAIADLCRKQSVRMVYVAPHHHYPTTAVLSPTRRQELLDLAETYGFIIVEDDYDYDFHYGQSPLLPMACSDSSGMTVYVGTFGRFMAPGFRSGFIVAPNELIREMEKLLAIIDRHGDAFTDLALGELIAEGEIHRYLRKTIREYKVRRDHLTDLLQQHLSRYLRFTTPESGLAIWTEWGPGINLMRLRDTCVRHELYLPRYLLYQTSRYSGIRIGFGSCTAQELTERIERLAHVVMTEMV